MTEVVTRNLQDITTLVAEIEEKGIFQKEEVRKLLSQVHSFEIKINSRSPAKQDFVKYIDYTYKCYKLVKVRKWRVEGIKVTRYAYGFIKWVVRLYKLALVRFPEDKILYLDYFDFCKETNVQVAKDVGMKMLKNHGHEEESWVIVSRHGTDSTTAVKLLLNGIKKHPGSSIIYLECIKRVLESATSDLNEQEIEVFNKKLLVYFKNMCEHISNVEHYEKFLTILREYNFTEPVINTVNEFLNNKLA